MPAYFLLDMLHSGYNTAISQCKAEHEKNAPGCRLSVTKNVTSTKAIVKVTGIAKTWLKSRAILDSCDSYAEHRTKFVSLMTQTEWKGVDL